MISAWQVRIVIKHCTEGNLSICFLCSRLLYKLNFFPFHQMFCSLFNDVRIPMNICCQGRLLYSSLFAGSYWQQDISSGKYSRISTHDPNAVFIFPSQLSPKSSNYYWSCDIGIYLFFLIWSATDISWKQRPSREADTRLPCRWTMFITAGHWAPF